MSHYAALLNPGHRQLKVVSEKRRHGDVYRFYGPSLRDVALAQLGPSADSSPLPPEHYPRVPKDSALMAFAQLAAIRIGASRSMISLIDGQHQHILAEATPTISLRSVPSSQASKELWLGNVSIPRSWGVCEQVVTLDPERISSSKDTATVIINDLLADERFAERSYVKESPSIRFYAGVPLISPSGSIVGALCIFDEKPREGLAQDDILYLEDLAITVIEYLETSTLKEGYRRSEQLFRGLISFAEGGSSIKAFHDTEQVFPKELPAHTEALKASEINTNVNAMSTPSTLAKSETNSLRPGQDILSSVEPSMNGLLQNVESNTVDAILHSAGQNSSVGDKSGKHDGPGRRHPDSIAALQDTILPANSKTMFARAANILRSSSDLDGVLILDASVAAIGNRRSAKDTAHTSDTGGDSASEARSTSSESEAPFRLPSSILEGSSRTHKKSANTQPGKMCEILGFSTPEKSGVAGDMAELAHRSLAEADLSRMLKSFPDGRVFNFTADGEVIPGTDDSDSASGTNADPEQDAAQKLSRRRLDMAHRAYNAWRAVAPGARSVAFIPLWDFERSRWFAGCVCWTNNPDRILSSQLDLIYFKVFGNSIMTELSRLDAIASSKTKSTFVASISHELRSPLHGILGALEFIQGTPLDSFQTTMLNSMTACGQTLLDTLNHVLDYAKINEIKRGVSSARMKGATSVQLSSRKVKTRRLGGLGSLAPAFDLSMVTEEVVEAVFAGQSYRTISSRKQEEDLLSSPEVLESSSGQAERKVLFVVLDLPDHQDWRFSLPVGAWRRILMNIFGNAIKYTESGFIKVSLQIADRSSRTDTASHVTLTITDSGIGMTPGYLTNKLFVPFSQENPLSPGTGLGLSIIRQIIETIGGKIEVNSEPSKGTTVIVKLALAKPEDLSLEPPRRKELLSASARLKGRRICILQNERWQSVTPNLPDTCEAIKLFTNALYNTLTDWLKMEVICTSEWQGHGADLVICTEPSFEYLSAIRNRRTGSNKAPVTIFVAMDALEAATLRSDARIACKDSVVEIITQPCGPYKLAKLLNDCITRYESPDENTPSHLPQPSSVLSEPEQENSRELLSPLKETLKASSLLEAIGAPLERTATMANPLTSLSIRQSADVSGILIVDDNEINRKLLAALMRKQKIPYQEAANGRDALQIYKEEPGRFDVILMDISMPVMDGMTATREIRRHEQHHNLKRITIIALTGLASASARLEAWSSGIDHFMTKPVHFEALRTLLGSKE